MKNGVERSLFKGEDLKYYKSLLGNQNISFLDLSIQGDGAFDHRKWLRVNVKYLKVFFILLLNQKFNDTLI